MAPPAVAADGGAAPAPPWWRRETAAELALAGAAGMLALAAVAVVLRLWKSKLGLPYGYGGDGLWLQQVVKAIVDHGWFLTIPDVGAPFGQELHDFSGALGDNLHFLIIKAMSVASQDPIKLVNAYFMLGFFLCAATACLVLRKLGVSRGGALVAAVLFSLLPAHVAGGEGRLMLGAYWAMPFSALLIMWVFAGEPLFDARADGGRMSRWASRRTLATLAMVLLIAGTGLYYALFTVIMLALAALAVAIARRDCRVAIHGALAGLIVLAIFLAHLSPSLLYTHRHGANPQLSQRSVADSSVYATNFAQLIMPVVGHRLNAADDIARRYSEDKPFPGGSETGLSALGLVGSLGFIGLLLVVVVPGVGSARERAGPAAATAVIAFLLGTTGGIGLLIALLVTPDLRAWGRISPLIGFVALFAAAVAYDALRARTAAAGRAWRRYAVAALLPVVLIVGVFDQTTQTMVPPYERNRDEYRSDAIFVDKIEAALPDRAGVLQLPAAAFPENGPIANMVDYSHMRGPLHAHALRFSYGAVKGRESGDWAIRLAQMPMEDALRHYVAAGFRGVWVDRRGYVDAGARVDRELRAQPGVAAPIVSDDDSLRLYSIVGYARRWAAGRTPQQLRAARDSAMYPTRVLPSAGMLLRADTGDPQIADPASGGSMSFISPGRLERTAVLTGRLGAAGDDDLRVEVTLPDATVTTLRASRRGTPFRLRLRLAAGTTSALRLRAAGARGPLWLRELRSVDESLR